jgi:hypothetical protein
MSDAALTPKERAGDEVIVRRDGVAGLLSLNRPKAIHALTAGMVQAMSAALLAWRDDPAVQVVILDHAEGRGFCSGGDINLIRQSALTDGGVSGLRFFYEEYQLNHLLFTYAKPVVAFMDGITMGGGVGIALPARFRVATENTRFAMPETGIGLFPDVGGGWHLSHLPGRIGQFLALTGARMAMTSAACWRRCRSNRRRPGWRAMRKTSPGISPPTGWRIYCCRWKAMTANGRPGNWRRCAPRARRRRKWRCTNWRKARKCPILPPTWPWNIASPRAC